MPAHYYGKLYVIVQGMFRKIRVFMYLFCEVYVGWHGWHNPYFLQFIGLIQQLGSFFLPYPTSTGHFCGKYNKV
jgi:hypothetical protein